MPNSQTVSVKLVIKMFRLLIASTLIAFAFANVLPLEDYTESEDFKAWSGRIVGGNDG